MSEDPGVTDHIGGIFDIFSGASALVFATALHDKLAEITGRAWARHRMLTSTL